MTGRDVVMVDFSYKRPVLLEMAEGEQHPDSRPPQDQRRGPD